MELYRICDKCKGTGSYLEASCDHCEGTGYIAFGGITYDSSTLNTLTDFQTYKLMEATTPSEYNALSAGNKDAYRQIVSCGEIDMTDGTGIRTKLWNMFDSESETRAALITLLGE